MAPEEKLLGYPWSSLGWYAAAREHRVERLEVGIGGIAIAAARVVAHRHARRRGHVGQRVPDLALEQRVTPRLGIVVSADGVWRTSVRDGLYGAGGNVMMIVFGGQDVYANFGAGTDLDLMPPQVIALEAGLVVWGTDRRAPVWNVAKQLVIVARTEAAAERVLQAAGI